MKKAKIKTVEDIKGLSWWVEKYEKNKRVATINVQKTSQGNYVVDSLRNMKIFPTSKKALDSAKRTIKKR